MITICDKHENIITEIESIKKKSDRCETKLKDIKYNIEDDNLEISDIVTDLNDVIYIVEDISYYLETCIELVKEANCMSEKMQNRLEDYYDAIENLGFKRDR